MPAAKNPEPIESWRPSALAQLDVPEDVWAEFLTHRKALKKPMTDYAQRLALRRLWRLKGQGQDPVAVIEQSIEMGWTGLFPAKGAQQGPSRRKESSRTAQALTALEDIANGR